MEKEEAAWLRVCRPASAESKAASAGDEDDDLLLQFGWFVSNGAILLSSGRCIRCCASSSEIGAGGERERERNCKWT